MLFAIFLSIMVLPAFGGETIRARWPLPIGDIISINLVEISSGSFSNHKSWLWKMG